MYTLRPRYDCRPVFQVAPSRIHSVTFAIVPARALAGCVILGANFINQTHAVLEYAGRNITFDAAGGRSSHGFLRPTESPLVAYCFSQQLDDWSVGVIDFALFSKLILDER